MSDTENTAEVPSFTREKKEIHTFSLVDTLLELQTAVQDGFVLDVETNEGFPQLFGSHYVITVYKDVKAAPNKDQKPTASQTESKEQSSSASGLKLKGRKTT
jgi:hypothetical protein